MMTKDIQWRAVFAAISALILGTGVLTPPPANATTLEEAIADYNAVGATLQDSWDVYVDDLDELWLRWSLMYEKFHLHLITEDENQAALYFGEFRAWESQVLAFLPEMDVSFDDYRWRVYAAVTLLNEICALDEVDTGHVAYQCGIHFIQPAQPIPIWRDPDHEFAENPEFTFPELCFGDNSHESWCESMTSWVEILPWVGHLIEYISAALHIGDAGLAGQRVISKIEEVHSVWCDTCLCELEFWEENLEQLDEKYRDWDCVYLFCKVIAHNYCGDPDATYLQKSGAVFTACGKLRNVFDQDHKTYKEEAITSYWGDQVEP